MSKKYDVVAVTGSYEKNGETKKKYRNVGVMMEGEHGPYILLERSFNPAGVPSKNGESIILNLFEPKMKEEGYKAAAKAAKGDDLADEIPF